MSGYAASLLLASGRAANTCVWGFCGSWPAMFTRLALLPGEAEDKKGTQAKDQKGENNIEAAAEAASCGQRRAAVAFPPGCPPFRRARLQAPPTAAALSAIQAPSSMLSRLAALPGGEPHRGQGQPEACVIDGRALRHLRQYQVEGVQFMLDCFAGRKTYGGTGCILADGMGLGKTLQAIAAVFSFLSAHQGSWPGAGKALVLCPASLVGNWSQEFGKWLGGHCRHIALTQRGKLAFARALGELDTEAQGRLPVVVITSYESACSNAEQVAQSAVDVLVCDEAHR